MFFDKKYMLLDLNMSHGIMSDFVSFPLFRFTLVIKSILKVIEILYLFFIKRDMDLNMSYGKILDFVSFTLFGFTFVIKLRNFDFEGH